MDPGFLHGMLAGRDRKLLERLFVLDTEGLRQGGTDLLQSGGDVASALLAAAGGIRQARVLKQTLERKRDELAPERRTASRPFYQALDRFLEARRRTGSETLRPTPGFASNMNLMNWKPAGAGITAMPRRPRSRLAGCNGSDGTAMAHAMDRRGKLAGGKP